MAQKKYGDEGPARPRQFSETQVQSMASGAGIVSAGLGPEDHARPRAISEREVATLAKGGEVNLEELPPVADIDEFVRPVHLDEKDVTARLQGKEIRLEDKSRLAAQ